MKVWYLRMNMMIVSIVLSLAIGLPVLASAQDCPAVPHGFTAEIQGSDLVFRWDNATDCTITSYELQVSRAPNIASQPLTSVSAFRFLNPTGSSVRFAGVGGFPAVYYARLVAFAQAQRSVPSPEITVIVGGGCGIPGVPQGLSATAVGNGVVLVSWFPPNGCQPEAYQVTLERSDGGTFQIVRQEFVRITTVPLYVGSADASYRVRVRSATRQGQSADATATVGVSSTPQFPPFAPTNFRADHLGNGIVQFAWEGGVNIFGSLTGPTTYAILISQSPADPGAASMPMGQVFSGFRVSAGATTGVFYLRLVATNGAGNSLPSNEVALYLPPR